MKLELFAIFKGQVQGVGFRYTTQNLAEKHQIKGTVRNLPDGSVELVAQGTQDQLDQFLAALDKEFSGYVAETQKNYRTPSINYSSFVITR